MAGRWILEADVPDGVVPFAAGESDGERTWLRDTVRDAGVGYLGVVAGERDGRTAVVVLAIAAAAMEFPAGTDPVRLLAATLRREYPEAIVEEFAIASGTGVGMRRWGRRHLTFGMKDFDCAGVTQALVPFADAGLIGAVTGLCFDAEDLDMTTVLTAAVAHRMRAVPG